MMRAIQFCTVSLLLNQVAGFAPVVRHGAFLETTTVSSRNSRIAPGPSSLVLQKMAEDSDSNEVATTTTTTKTETPASTATTVAPVAPPAGETTSVSISNSNSNDNTKTAKMMDERIYKFNKIVIDTVYDIICFVYPVTGGKRDFARFFVLETVARVPYFAYLSVMHLRETFGERNLGELMRTHYAEADNELHHLLIMEELGGNDNAIDRFVAQTMAFFYYWYVVVVYSISEPAAYHLSELIEDHAFETYDGFLAEHGDRLKKMPVPAIAHKYYELDNPFLFDLFCTVKDKDEQGNYSARRPKLESLYDVFVNVRDDEREHWKTLCNLVQYGDMQGVENKMVQGTKPIPVAQE